MKEFKRYAVYFLPQADSALAQFGAAWLGWDVASGGEISYPAWVTEGHAERVATPVKYGFHGTVKPPMRLAEGKSLESLRQRLQAVCQSHQAFTLPAFVLKDIGNFLCFTLSQPSAELQNLAEDCVRQLDDWRKPASEQELQRRRAAGLSERQAQLLEQWGYPYVFDQFKFHLTLSGKLNDTERAEQLALLQQHIHDLLNQTTTMLDLCLCGESEQGRFYLIERFPLAG